MSEQFEIGSVVTAEYKTGEYAGEVVEVSPSGKIAVKILAVIKHPTQGDLHNPMDPNVPFFHQRRALAFQEIALIPRYSLKTFHGTVQDYRTSLERALHSEIRQLKQTVHWAERSLQELEQLQKDYSI
ncbi:MULTISPECIES: kinase-associated lipoprotein B [Paenibacillus]|uniref:Kinase-associated lipoprotein B n=1 Tax=Paenibacillus radicis (ex Xue et al. 2023) TaxID=2972489 RepID=A0ABT1YF69_9BACL|nr:kinase-associated lipoprotein B [Paenibacillus radicis (ex Xue et al. 2023)]MCR8631846.1 kinase-associated lipoprotein B [Paenibacillus radicis (ex Xue et al. 2023)]